MKQIRKQLAALLAGCGPGGSVRGPGFCRRHGRQH